MDGPGIAVFHGAFDGAVIDRSTDAFNEILDRQRAAGLVSGDHFAKPGCQRPDLGRPGQAGRRALRHAGGNGWTMYLPHS